MLVRWFGCFFLGAAAGAIKVFRTTLPPVEAFQAEYNRCEVIKDLVLSRSATWELCLEGPDRSGIRLGGVSKVRIAI